MHDPNTLPDQGDRPIGFQSRHLIRREGVRANQATEDRELRRRSRERREWPTCVHPPDLSTARNSDAPLPLSSCCLTSCRSAPPSPTATAGRLRAAISNSFRNEFDAGTTSVPLASSSGLSGAVRHLAVMTLRDNVDAGAEALGTHGRSVAHNNTRNSARLFRTEPAAPFWLVAY